MLTAITQEGFKIAFEEAPCPALLLDCNLTVLACNSAYENAVQKDRAVMLGRPIFDIFPGSDDQQSEIMRDSYQRVMDSRRPHHISQIQYSVAAQGTHEDRYWTVSNTPLFDSDDVLRGILHCAADVTELVQQDHQDPGSLDVALMAGQQATTQRWTRNIQNILQSEIQRLQQLFKQAPGFICVLQGPNHVFELANDAYYQLAGHRTIIGHPFSKVMPEVIEQGFLAKLDSVYATGTPFVGRAMPIKLQREAGSELEQRFIDLIYQPIFDANRAVSGIFLQGNDVTEAYELGQEIAYQAAHDALTGLINRREFTARTEHIAGPGPHALLYMDIDHFKIINDRRGHAAGNGLLIQVANLLTSTCASDDLLARFGGDEFVLVRPDCGPDDALEWANRLCAAIENIDFMWQDRRYGVTVSVGVAFAGDPEGLSFESALAQADAACFLAKEKGRNRVQVSLPSDEEIRQQQQDMDSVTRLKDAMREDRVLLYAQRIVPFHAGADHQEVFCEVLARIQDLDGTVVLPGAFIPAAERFGLIEELDRHIVRKTFAHIQAQSTQPGETPCYFINLSGITLSAPGFLAFVEASLEAYPLVRSSRICFEVTETAALSNVKRTADAMRRLIAMGFQFALDDFGSGMASFTYLRHLPVHYVKIDGEFVKAILDQPASAIIVEAVIKVAQTMNMRTIAESVESEALIPLLKSLNIDYAPGFALHKPAPL